MYLLYGLTALPLLGALAAPDGGTALLLAGFSLLIGGLLFALTRYVNGKGQVMADRLAQRAAGRQPRPQGARGAHNLGKAR